jgi:hypothetical protein
MSEEPRHEYYGVPVSEFIVHVAKELPVDSV